MIGTTIRVEVVGTIREYPADIAGFGEHLAQGGITVSLTTALAQAKALFKSDKVGMWKAVSFWVTMDNSGLAYRVSITRRGSHTVEAASPLPGVGNVKDVYVA